MKPRAPTETPLDPSPASSRPSVAIAGLLIVCGVLATGLVATAYANERAAVRAATAVLRGRAQDTTNAAIALLRISRRMHKPLDLTDVAKASARDGVEVAFIDPRRQRLLARAGGSETTAPVLGSVAKIPAEVRIALRAQGQATRSKDNVFELWRPFFVGRGPGPGRHGQGRGLGRRWRRRHPAGPLQPQGIRPPEAHPPRGPKHRPRAFTLLRVRVPRHLASEVTAAARSTLIFAAASALLLLLSAAGLFRAARRAQRTAVELRRRETLSSLGEMAAILAHEIRTPLGSMKGNAQLLAEDAPKDDRASAIVSEATRLERLVNGMLDVARPAPPRHEAVNPDLVAERAAEIVAPLAAKSGVTLLTDPAGDAPTLDADPDKLLQVLVNLLQNAVQATAETQTDDPVVLTVRRARGDVTFSVQDRGTGLTEPVEHLLRPFYSTKRQGTGLGLSVARQIVHQHGGDLRIEARRGGGVEARAIFPTARGKREARQDHETKSLL